MPHYKVMCLLSAEETGEGRDRMVFASRSKVFKTTKEAEDYFVDRSRMKEIWTCEQIRSALWLAAKCRCHECQYCDIARDYWSNPGAVKLELPKEVQLCLV